MFWPIFKTLTYLASCFVRNQRVPVDLPEGYTALTAQEKLDWLREQSQARSLLQNEALPPNRLAPDILHTLCRMDQNLDHSGELRPAKFGSKPLHPAGVTAAVSLKKLNEADFEHLDWEARPDDLERARRHALGYGPSIMSGLLNGCEHAIIRVSEAVPYGFKLPFRPPFGHVPGLSLKCLVDGHPSADLVFLDTMEGQGNDGYPFARPLSSILSPPKRMETHLIADLFNDIEDKAGVIATTPLALIEPDGSPVDNPIVPDQLHFVAHAATEAAYRNEHTDVRLNLIQSYAEGDCLGYIFAANARGALGIPILKVVLKSAFLASGFDDTELFFRHNRKPKPPAVSLSTRCSRLILSGFTWMFTAAFGLNALIKGGRSTHTHGVGARGGITFRSNTAIPEHPFFPRGRQRSVSVRHANVIPEDDAKKAFRGMALRIDGLPHEGSLDILMNTGPRGVFWHARNFVRGVAAAGAYTEFALWLVQKLTPTMHAHMQLAARRAPKDYTLLYYYSRIALYYYAYDGVPRLARFRCRPASDAPDHEGLAPDGSPDRISSWTRVRLPHEKRPSNYLRSDFDYDMRNQIPHFYYLEIQTIEPGNMEDNSLYDIKRDWPDAPWQILGEVTLDQSIDARECEQMTFGIHQMPRSLEVPRADSIADYRSIGDMRLKVYPRLQCMRKCLGLRPRRGAGLPDPRKRRAKLTLRFPVKTMTDRAELYRLLEQLDPVAGAPSDFPLATFETVHRAQFTILKGSDSADAGALMYSAEVDGEPEEHLWRLARNAPALHELLRHCANFPCPTEASELYHWMLPQLSQAAHFYRGHNRCSVRQIREEARLIEVLREEIERNDYSGKSALETIHLLRQLVDQEIGIAKGVAGKRSLRGNFGAFFERFFAPHFQEPEAPADFEYAGYSELSDETITRNQKTRELFWTLETEAAASQWLQSLKAFREKSDIPNG